MQPTSSEPAAPTGPADAFNRLVKLAGSYAAIARRLNLETGYGVSKWRDKVPPERVIPLCEIVEFEVTPHELRPDLYPHHEDGLPAARRAGSIPTVLDELSQVLTEEEHRDLIAAMAQGPEAAHGFIRALEHRPDVKFKMSEMLIALGRGSAQGQEPASDSS